MTVDTIHTTPKDNTWLYVIGDKSKHWIFLRKTLQRYYTIKQPELKRSIIKNGFEFAKECKRKGHKLYVLSNWDKESFALVKQTHPEVFGLFDGIMILTTNYKIKRFCA